MNVEIFSGAGGLAHGFRAAGITFDLAVDMDSEACDSYELNLGIRPVEMDIRALIEAGSSRWRTGPVDLLVADPPCAMWSRAGKRSGLADGRDMLPETVELIRRVRPNCWLIGNIPGLEDAPNWPVVQRLIGGLADVGYCVVDFAVLNAADYGVPQRRVRPFWFGHLSGPCLRWPAPTHGPDAASLPGLGLLPWVTCREALSHLPVEEIGRPLWMKLRPHRTGTAERCKAGSDLTRCSDPDRPAATVVSHPSSKGGQIIVTARGRRPTSTADVGSQVLEWPWDRPATTVTDDERLAPPGRRPAEGIGSILSAPNAIVLSERAAAILQGFPDGWLFVGRTKRSRWSQIGQAVPPPLAEAIGRAVLSQMRAHPITGAQP